jgi:chemotaxis protein MotB
MASRVFSASAPSDASVSDDEAVTQLRQELTEALSAEISEQKIALRHEPNGLVISLREVGFFDSGSAHIKPESLAAFDRIAMILRDKKYPLRIEGHTDDVPIHTSQFASNWELSAARATELVRTLIVRNGFPANRLSAGGFAEFHPVATNQTAEGRAQNRRVDVVILEQSPNDTSRPAQTVHG